jgi:hypothetical protein
VSIDLGRRLLASGTIHPGELRRALHDAIVRERPFVRALIEASSSAREVLGRALESSHAPGGGASRHPTVKSVIAYEPLLAELPPGLATRLLVVPLRKDARPGTVDVAMVDPDDVHAAAEVSFHLGAPVRPVAAPLVEIERALLLDISTKVSTAEYEAARPSQIPEPIPLTAPVPSVAPASTPEEFVVPLVRRPRASLASPPPSPRMGTSDSIPPPSRMRASLAPPTTTPFSERPVAVEMVVDFSAAARAEQEEAAAVTRRGVPPDPGEQKLEEKRPPFASLTPILERIDVVTDRDGLIEALLRGLATTAACAALFAPRRGKFVGVGAAGALDSEQIRGVIVPAHGAMAETVGKGERLGALDPRVDRDLYQALELHRYYSDSSRAHVLLSTSYLSDRAALVLVAYGMGDVIEASRRARVLSTAASAAMTRLLKR